MQRPPFFSETAARYGVGGCQFCDFAVGQRRYAATVLVVAFDDRCCRDFHFLAAVTATTDSGVFYCDAADIVYLGCDCRPLPPKLLVALVCRGGLVVDFRSRQCFTLN